MSHKLKYQKDSKVIDSLTVVMSNIDVDDCNRVAFHVAVTENNLSEFVISGRFNKTGCYSPLFETSADFANPMGILLGASGDLTTQAVGNGWFMLNCECLESLQISAASNSVNGSSVCVQGSGR